MDRFVVINSPTNGEPNKKESTASSSQVMCTDRIEDDTSIQLSVSACKDDNPEDIAIGV